MIFLIISYILIITGFILFFIRKKIKKNETGLKVAKITEVKKVDESYELTLKYSFDKGATFVTGTIFTNKKKHIGEEIIIRILDDDSLELYHDDRIIIYLAMGCWILGMLILCLFCK